MFCTSIQCVTKLSEAVSSMMSVSSYGSVSRLYRKAVVLDDEEYDEDVDADDLDDETDEMDDSIRLLPFKCFCLPIFTFKNNHKVTMSVVGAINNINLATKGHPSPSSLLRRSDML